MSKNNKEKGLAGTPPAAFIQGCLQADDEEFELLWSRIGT